MHLSFLTAAMAVGVAIASPVSTSVTSVPTISMTVGAPTPLVTENRMVARAALPTCDPAHVAIVTSQKPSSSAFCSRWRAAGTVHSAPVTVTGLANWQISNICSCIYAGTYVANPPGATTTTIKKTSTTTSKTTSKTSSAAVATASTYQELVIAHHNVHRTNHSASALTWSSSLAATAKQIGASCVYAHNVTANGGGYGQNIAAGAPSSQIAEVISNLFYNNEVIHYPLPYGVQSPDMTNFEEWGHFSQIVWKSTTQVGCATVDCTAKGLSNVGSDVAPYFTVCNYSPPGNYLGEFGTGVGASLNEATVYGDTALPIGG